MTSPRFRVGEKVQINDKCMFGAYRGQTGTIIDHNIDHEGLHNYTITGVTNAFGLPTEPNLMERSLDPAIRTSATPIRDQV